MARQARSELTRRKLLDAAVDVFDDVGYVAAGRAAIIDRAGVTKGALYHHFESMESLVAAIVDGGFTVILDTFSGMCQPTSPALEGVIHGTFAVTDVVAHDKQARVGLHLLFASSGADDAVAARCATLQGELCAQVARAIVEGDLRAEVDTDQAGESIMAAMLGSWLLSPCRAEDAVGRLTRLWEALLPVLVVEESLAYYRQFLGREALRHGPAET